MTPDAASRAVEEYLRRLGSATAGLHAARRDELLAEIREHVEATAGSDADETQVRAVLDRLGPPEEIARAELDALPPVPGGPVLEAGALLVLLIGSILQGVGWLAGAVLALLSSRWTGWQKALAVLVPPLPALYLLVSSYEQSDDCVGRIDVATGASEQVCAGTASSARGWTLLVLGPLALVAAAYLLREALRRPPARPASSPATSALVAIAALPAVVPVLGSLVACFLALTGAAWPHGRRQAAAALLLVGAALNPLLGALLISLVPGAVAFGSTEMMLMFLASVLTGPLAACLLLSRRRA